ncbi:hypothetical protein IEQ34_003500 [Dendrobium chrysotoxum]|uniref:Secreted protein n=1 Tax=Dendrobium chrysotoxum TaxID=161865 RepID=A0AAV7HKU3_DENCH|nr:hypothetical protein IEQ34_003500 [Dendrobium chrysotoxum]
MLLLLLPLSPCGSSLASLINPHRISAGGMKQSNERPGTLKATSSIVHASSILVFVWLIASSPKRNRVTTERPE